MRKSAGLTLIILFVGAVFFTVHAEARAYKYSYRWRTVPVTKPYLSPTIRNQHVPTPLPSSRMEGLTLLSPKSYLPSDIPGHATFASVQYGPYTVMRYLKRTGQKGGGVLAEVPFAASYSARSAENGDVLQRSLRPSAPSDASVSALKADILKEKQKYDDLLELNQSLRSEFKKQMGRDPYTADFQKIAAQHREAMGQAETVQGLKMRLGMLKICTEDLEELNYVVSRDFFRSI